MFKPILRVLLTALLPILFAGIIGRFPDFPLDQAGFMAVIFWTLEKIGILAGAIVAYVQVVKLQKQGVL